jgi:hypothetical protein
MSRIVIVTLIYNCNEPIDRNNLLGLKRGRNVLPVKYAKTY